MQSDKPLALILLFPAKADPQTNYLNFVLRPILLKTRKKWRTVFLQKTKAFSTQHTTWYLSLPVALTEEIVRLLSPSVCIFLEIVKSEVISPTGKIWSFSTE
jgi:hypothetical protein